MTVPIRPERADPALGPTRALARTQEAAKVVAETPEQARRVLQLQRLTGYTSDFIRGNRDAVEKAVGVPGFDPERFAKEAPIVSQWMAADPSRVALMSQDWTRMGLVERHTKHIAQQFRIGVAQTRLMRIGEAALMGTATPEQRAEQRRLESETANPEDFGVSGFFAEAPGAAAQQLPILGRTIKAGLTEGARGLAVGAGVGAVVGTLAGPEGTIAGAEQGAKLGFQTGAKVGVAWDVALMEASSAMLEYEKLTDANGQPLDAETARGAALIAGAISGSLELISLSQAAKLVPGLRAPGGGAALIKGALMGPTTRGILLRIAKDIGVSAATEGLTETLQSLVTQGGGRLALAAQDGRLSTDFAGVLAEVFSKEALTNALAEGKAAIQSQIVLGSLGGVASSVQDVRRAARAERQAPAIQALADAGADAKVTEEAPDEVKDLVTSLRQSGVSGFSYSVAEWDTFFQGATAEAERIDPRQVAVEVGVADAYDAAKETGGTFEVPLGDWLTKLARNPDVRSWAVQHARVGPGEMSAAEAVRQRDESDAVLTDLIDTMVKAKEEVRPTDQFAETLRSRVENAVRSSGRPVREAQRAGELWSSVYRTWAAESGSTPEDLMAMFSRVRIGNETQAETTETTRPPLAETATPAEVASYVSARERESERQAIAAAEDTGPQGTVRDKRGRVKAKLTQASRAELVREYRTIRDAINQAEGEATSIEDDPAMQRAIDLARQGRTEEAQGAYEEAGGSGAVWDFAERMKMAKASETRRVADTKVLERLAAELATRGIDPDAEALSTDFDPTTFQQAAFHGTPHLFDKFSTAKMGTGEGAQAYGWGLYFAENEGIAEGYRKALSMKIGGALAAQPRNYAISEIVQRNLGDTATMRAELVAWTQDENNKVSPYAFVEDAQRIVDAIDAGTFDPSGGALYRVDISDAAVATFLDWDKPLSEQAPEVREAVRTLLPKLPDVAKGWQAYDALKNNMMSAREPSQRSGLETYAEAASKALLDAGVRGIKYLDAGSRRTLTREEAATYEVGKAAGSGQWGLYSKENGYQDTDFTFSSEKEAQDFLDNPPPQTRNLVVFDENDVTITHKNGEPVSKAERADVLRQAAPVTVQDIETLGAVEAHEMREDQPDASVTDIATALSTSPESVARWLAVPKPDLTPEQIRELGVRVAFAQKGEETTRGSITFTDARQKAHIQLFASANASTFFHESAHLFLTFMGQLASSEKASQRIKADYAKALEWLGATPGQALTVEQEEQWARGFEAYLFEGKAPSAETRSLFATMQAWLTRIYRTIRGLDVELNDDIRRVFDRILATDAAIQEAEESNLYAPLFPDAAQVMPPAEAAHYAEAVVKAQEAAGERLRVETLDVIAREEKAWYKARKEELRPEVTAQVLADPAMIARTTLQSGTMPDGTELAADDPLRQKLDRQAVDALLGEGGWKRLPRGTTAASGGLHPDVAATALGFANGTELLDGLRTTQSVPRETESRLNARLVEEYGDPLTDGTLPAKAITSIHTEARDRVTRLELEELQRRDPAALKGLLRRFGGRVPVTADVQRQADRMLSDRTIKSIRPVEFQRAEVKAAKEAIAAAVKGEWVQAAEAKIRERLASALYRAAVSAGEEIEKAQTRYAKMFRPDDVLAKTRDLNLVNAARAVLARVGLGRADKRAEEYLAAVEAYDPETFEALKPLVISDVPARDDARDLTLAEFRTVDEQAMGLWNQSKRTRQMVIDGKKVDREYVIDTLAAELEGLPDRMKGAGVKEAYKPTDTIRRRLIGMEGALRRVESWVDQMDQGASNGPWRRFVWNPISEAAAAFRVTKRDLTTRYLAIVKGMPAERWKSGQIAAPELGYTFRDRQELLGAMLHTGNLSNMEKLLKGRRWDPASWAQFIGRLQRENVLTLDDYTFLQGVWDLFESVKPDAQKVHHELLGYYFDEITAAPVVTPYGTFKGGYVPALADPQLSEDARIRQDKAAQDEVHPSSMFPSVSRGFTKARVEGYNRPLVMDLKLVRMHLDAVSRFIHLAQPTKDVGRLTMDRRFRDALGAVDPEMGAELAAWVQRAGQQVVETPSRSGGGKAADAVFRWLRTSSGLQIMALNVTNTLQQYTGLAIGAVKVKPKYLRNALWQATHSPKQTAAAVAERSPYMATRVSAGVMEVQRRIDNLITNPSKYEQARAFATEHGYILQSTTQGMVDTVVWTGAFDQATAEGQTEKDAVRIADSAVRLTQGSFAPEDVSRFETGSPFVRAFTMFYSYFNMQANLLRSEFAQVVRQSGLRKGAGRMLYVYVMGFMVPAVLSQAIVELMSGGPDDEDDDGYLDEWMSVFFSSQGRSAFALVPGGNVVLQAGINQFNDKWYDDRVNVSPAVTTIESAGRGGKAVLYDWWVDGEVQRRDIRDVLTLLSLLSRLPLTGLSRPASYLFDVQQGDAEPTGPVDYTRGLLSGRP